MLNGKMLCCATVILLTASSVVYGRVPAPADMPMHVRHESPHTPEAARYYVKDWVRQGLMTEEEARKTEAYMQFRFDRRKADLTYVRRMNRDDRRAYMAEKQRERGNPLAEYANYCGLTYERARDLMNLVHGNGKGTDYYEQLKK